MHTASGVRGNCATFGGAETGIDFSVSGIVSPLQAAINDIFRIKHPCKTWGFLAK
jgi:hypothetical protein